MLTVTGDTLQCLIQCLIIWKVKSYNKGFSEVKEVWHHKSFLQKKGMEVKLQWQMAWDCSQELKWSKHSNFTEDSCDLLFSFNHSHATL